MRTEHFFYILIASFGLIGFIGLILYLQGKNSKISNFGNKLGKVALYIIGVIFVFLIIPRRADSYRLWNEQRFWQKYHLPQIDSTMIYQYSSKSMEIYKSCSNDSILHDRKLIDKDLYDVYSVTDEFVNMKDSLILKSRFIKPNILRDSARYFTLSKWGIKTNSIEETITKVEFDSLLHVWGLSENLYKIFEID
ncbi:MAG: hypothetical protein ACOYEG_07365 [Petrimonas sp.]|jgi:hypothetical protein